MEQADENDLIARAQLGDVEAFGILYELNFDWISKFVYSRVFNHEDARDIVQDVFIRALENIKQYNGSSPFRAWLTGIVKNVMYDYFQSRQQLENKLPQLYDPADSFALHEVDNRIDAQRLVTQILDSLNPSQRQILEMRIMQGRSIGEVAAIVYGHDNDENRRKVSSQLYKAVQAAHQTALLIVHTSINE